MITGWVAVKHISNGFGEWCIVPKAFFEANGFVPATKANLEVPGMEEILPSTLKPLDDSDGVSLLLAAGFEIDNDPNWFYKRV